MVVLPPNGALQPYKNETRGNNGEDDEQSQVGNWVADFSLLEIGNRVADFSSLEVDN